jgi:hypothetical protein
MGNDAPVAEIGSCWECGYSLRGLGEGRRCPECGRAFDPADRTTMNVGRPVGPVARWLMRPPGWPLYAMTVVAALVSLWAAATPVREGVFVRVIVDMMLGRTGVRQAWGSLRNLDDPRGRFLIGACAWLVVGAVWAGRRIARGMVVRRLSARRAPPFAYWWRWLVTPLAFAAVVLVCRTTVPHYLGFWIGRASLERMASDARSAPAGTGLHRRIWIYATGNWGADPQFFPGRDQVAIGICDGVLLVQSHAPVDEAAARYLAARGGAVNAYRVGERWYVVQYGSW